MVAVSPQKEEHSQKLVEAKNLTFDILSDPDNQYSSQLGLVFSLPEDLKEVYHKLRIDLVRFNGNESWALPMPARFIIDTNGTIQYANAEPDYTRRPEPIETLEALKTLM